METWHPHKTVAVIVEQQENLRDPAASRFLMVEERSDGKAVFNQPAGHLDPDESLAEAALREALEETGWEVELTGFLGLYHHVAPQQATSYIRSCFIARAVRYRPDLPLDPDIMAVHWLTLPELLQRQSQMRSPLVMPVVDDYLAGRCWPLDILHTVHPAVSRS